MAQLKQIRLILFFTVFLISAEEIFPQSISFNVPTGVFATHSDYVQHKIKPMDDFVMLVDTLGSFFIIFEKKGKKQKVECSKVWGFQYKFKLFRCNGAKHPPARVISNGKITYYENGPAHLDMLKNETSEAHFSEGAYCYFSVNLLGNMLEMPSKFSREVYGDVEKFKTKHKQYKKLFSCIETNYNPAKIYDCVKAFERGK